MRAIWGAYAYRLNLRIGNEVCHATVCAHVSLGGKSGGAGTILVRHAGEVRGAASLGDCRQGSGMPTRDHTAPNNAEANGRFVQFAFILSRAVPDGPLLEWHSGIVLVRSANLSVEQL